MAVECIFLMSTAMAVECILWCLQPVAVEFQSGCRKKSGCRKTAHEKHKLENDSIDYYGARNLIVSMLDFLGTKEENHMVEMIPGTGARTVSRNLQTMNLK